MVLIWEHTGTSVRCKLFVERSDNSAVRKMLGTNGSCYRNPAQKLLHQASHHSGYTGRQETRAQMMWSV